MGGWNYLRCGTWATRHLHSFHPAFTGKFFHLSLLNAGKLFCDSSPQELYRWSILNLTLNLEDPVFRLA